MTPEKRVEIDGKIDKAISSVTRGMGVEEMLYVVECLEEIADWIGTSLKNKGEK